MTTDEYITQACDEVIARVEAGTLKADAAYDEVCWLVITHARKVCLRSLVDGIIATLNPPTA